MGVCAPWALICMHSIRVRCIRQRLDTFAKSKCLRCLWCPFTILCTRTRCVSVKLPRLANSNGPRTHSVYVCASREQMGRLESPGWSARDAMTRWRIQAYTHTHTRTHAHTITIRFRGVRLCVTNAIFMYMYVVYGCLCVRACDCVGFDWCACVCVYVSVAFRALYRNSAWWKTLVMMMMMMRNYAHYFVSLFVFVRGFVSGSGELDAYFWSSSSARSCCSVVGGGRVYAMRRMRSRRLMDEVWSLTACTTHTHTGFGRPVGVVVVVVDGIIVRRVHWITHARGRGRGHE